MHGGVQSNGDHGDHQQVEPNQIPKADVEALMERLADRIKDYIAGSNFEDDIHKLACDELGIHVSYDPEKADEHNPYQVFVQTSYYNAYALIQSRILVNAASGM